MSDIILEAAEPLMFPFRYVSAFPRAAMRPVIECLPNVEQVFIASRNEQPLGCIALARFGNTLDVCTAFVIEPERGAGLGVKLFSMAVEYARQRGIRLLLRVVRPLFAPDATADVLEHWADRFGLVKNITARIYIVRSSEAHTQAAWQGVMERVGDRLLTRCERAGMRTHTFKDADAAVISSLKESVGVRFRAELNPFKSEFSPENSYVTHINGRAVSFCTARRFGNKSVLDMLSADSACAGAFFPPLHAFAEKIIADAQKSVFFTVYDYNTPMIALAGSLLSPVAEYAKKQTNYLL